VITASVYEPNSEIGRTTDNESTTIL